MTARVSVAELDGKLADHVSAATLVQTETLKRLIGIEERMTRRDTRFVLIEQQLRRWTGR